MDSKSVTKEEKKRKLTTVMLYIELMKLMPLILKRLKTEYSMATIPRYSHRLIHGERDTFFNKGMRLRTKGGHGDIVSGMVNLGF